MSLFDDLLGNADAIATQLGLPADKAQALVETVKGQLGQGGDPMSALAAAAQDHGLPIEKLHEMLGSLGGAGGLMGLFDHNADGNPVEDLASMASGLFGRS